MQNKISRGISNGLVATLILLCAVVYFPSLQNDFVWDDRIFLVESEAYRGVGSIERSLTEPFVLHNAYYRPFATLTFALIPASLEHAATLHHALNLFTLLLVVLSAFLCTRAAGSALLGLAPDSPLVFWSALSTATVIGLHPIAFEPLLWISGRFDLLLCLWYLLLTLVLLRMQPSVTRGIVIAALYFLAATSKETAVSFPLIVVVVHIALRICTSRQLSARRYFLLHKDAYIAMAISGLLYLALRYIVLGHIGTDDVANALTDSLASRMVLASLSLIAYAKLVFVPWVYSAPIHPVDVSTITGAWYVLPVLFTLLASGLAYVLYSGRSIWPAPALIFVAGVLPVLHLLSFSAAGSLIADRYAFAPFATALVLAAPLIASRISRLSMTLAFRGTLVLVALVVICSWVLMARVTTQVWRNDHSLWDYAFARAPESHMAIQNKVTSLLVTRRYDEAEKLLNVMHERKRLPAPALTNLALLRGVRGDFDNAYGLLNAVDSQRSRLSDAERGAFFCTYAQIDFMRAAWNDVLANARNALRWDASNATCQRLEIRALYMLGDTEKANALVEVRKTTATPEMREELESYKYLPSPPKSR